MLVCSVLVLACLVAPIAPLAPPPQDLTAGKPGPAAPAPLVNADFETPATKTDPVPGWTVEIGALNGGSEPLNEVEVDKGQKHGGKASLHLSASASTLAFQIVSQSVEVRPGGKYKLSAFTRTKGLRHEQNARGINQFNNCYLALFLFDGVGEVKAKDVKTLKQPETNGWEPVQVEVTAPDDIRRAEIKVFSSISGEVWLDDVSLSIEGGKPVPPPVVVFEEDFEALKELPPAWLIEEGARNGGDAPPSTVEVSTKEGAHKSKRSLHLGGSAKTILWNSVNRYFEARPGDALHFSAQVKAEKVRPEKNVKGIDQFTNLHLRLVFFDEAGETLGAPRFESPGDGSYDWKPVSVRAVAPEGAVRGMAGMFLSMSGDVWLDDVALTTQVGGTPAYDGWQTLDTAHLKLRFPPDHPRAAEMAEYGKRLEAALAQAAAALKAEVGQPITMFLYRDGEQGQALTGRELAYAESERRAVHQGPTNTLCHELVHVLALQRLGYAQTGLFGEGLAVWLDGEGADEHHDVAAALLKSGELPTMEALLKEFRQQAKGYPAAGSFCGWLLQTHGLDAFSRLYPLSDPAAAAPAILKQPWTDVDAAWRAFLAARSEGGGATGAEGAPGASKPGG